jgi:uncharacterized protein GlcG (DUF336 family)
LSKQDFAALSEAEDLPSIQQEGKSRLPVRTAEKGISCRVLDAHNSAPYHESMQKHVLINKKEDSPMRTMNLATVFCVVALFIAGPSFAQQLPNPYGPNINLVTAKKVAAAAAAKSVEMKVNAVIAIVDTGGQLVYLERFDVVQWGSNDVAIHKAKASVQYKRATLALENAVKSNIHYLTLDGISAIEGGVPIIEGGKIIGAIGVSGGSSAQDGQVAGAGAAVIK